MDTTTLSFAALSDQNLLTAVKDLVRSERQATAHLIASLMELDIRRLYLSEGCSSLFTYCTKVLHLSEHAAYGRIEAARAARRFPMILELLADGSITLTTVTLLAPHLTPNNYSAVLNAAQYKSKREVERQVASLHPRPDVPSSIRKQPTMNSSADTIVAPAEAPSFTSDPLLVPTASAHSVLLPTAPSGPSGSKAPGNSETASISLSPGTSRAQPHARRSVIEPLTAERYKVQVTVRSDTVEKFRRIQDLMRHIIPNGDPATILDRALTMLLEHLERSKLAATDGPRARRTSRVRSRCIPAAIRRAVWARDAGQCTFIGTEGRCNERGFVEFHHLNPYARGGDTTLENITLRCRSHNAYEAEQEFGRRPAACSRRATQPTVVREECSNFG
jgi:hypothetical protein